MLFSSAIFLFCFLPAVLLVYYILPFRFRNALLFLSSLVFYSWGEEKIVLIMLAAIFINYIAALYIDKGYKKAGIIVALVSTLSFLIFYKYFNFTFDNFRRLLGLAGISAPVLERLPYIALPIGISFYTFQILSYTIDVYRGNVRANKNFIDFAAYITMFPQLVAGPIVRYIDIEKQLKNRVLSTDNFARGIERFVIGLGKKMIIANSFAAVADEIFAFQINEISTATAWIGVISYTFQIYYDFSGYSDMAIGMGKMFGFEFLENFKYPYISVSIREFWRRWHISLSSWFRDYLYIPLGGNKMGTGRTYLNLIIVFFITGLWHGASWNFVVWGLFHGFFIILERIGFGKILERTWKPVAHIYVLLVIIVGWVFFRSENLSYSIQYLATMFGVNSGEPFYGLTKYLNPENSFLVCFAILFSTPAYPAIIKWFTPDRLSTGFANHAFRLVHIILILLLFVACIGYLSADTYNPFIYFRF